jgi:Fe-S-cluster-containing dehydrogenase component/anaerobic selenocysteine-containing dehydrogenase
MKTYYKGIEELIQANENLTAGEQEHTPPVKLTAYPVETSRRDFLKTFGFAIAGSALAAGCERPVNKAIPYLINQDEIIPGKSTYYASTFYDGENYNSILVKVRDGRPIKIEGNELSSLSHGRTSALVQGSVLELYDENRYRGPLMLGETTSWEEVDGRIGNLLAAAEGKVVLLSGGIISPSTMEVIRSFGESAGRFEHIVYDPVSVAALLEANERSFGKRVIPDYRFDRADLIIGVGADFLGTWIAPVEYTIRYSSNRRPTEEHPHMSRHIQIESGMSLTGSNADERITIRPSQQKAVLISLLSHLMGESGIDPGSGNLHISPIDTRPLAQELLESRGKALVVCGSNDPEVQFVVNGINSLIGAFGNTIDLDRPLYTRQGDDRKMETLVQEMNEGSISGILFYNTNPAYDYPARERFLSGMEKLAFAISLNPARDETSLLCDFVCPDHHYLESWNDAHPREGTYSLSQPSIRHIFDTRQAQESLMTWSGQELPFDDLIQRHWENNIYPLSGRQDSFPVFWNKTIHDGVFEVQVPAGDTPSMDLAQLKNILSENPDGEDGGPELELVIPVNTGTGKHANNPWLQETPDPVSKITWDNYASVSPSFASDNGLSTGDVIRINGLLEIPVYIQPGQQRDTISVALGYGREAAGRASEGVGKNFYPLVRFGNGLRQYYSSIRIEPTGGFEELASTQRHHSMEGRPLIRETTLEAWKGDPASGNELHEYIQDHHHTLYDKNEYRGHHWGMTVDLNTCTGCNACVVACTAENNVSVVGKELVKQAKEMHWIRIDRYYSGNPENPQVSRQPVMCQHCDHAPCENVCPVSATTQSSEGINQMIYNRCVGTRYCNNNCPYKVRRFNWLDFTKADAIPNNTYDPHNMTLDLSRMVLNPDVTVRAKGVMEKCSFCIQRIQEKKLQAKLENRALEPNEVLTACAQVCPANAIIFGDLNKEESQVSRNLKDPRNYHLLEELHTLPSVSYLTNIRNRKEDIAGQNETGSHG